ncbi:MAG TPA: hypothetical protein VNA20_16370 [Frankiaceae bacterium]|nr:hypothetical protein [Frankiaceae bacterium]
MGCYVCGARQTDPARGASPWQRGVVGGQQVLGCPDCQASGEWAASLDRCAGCGSTALARRLGETTCGACGQAGDGLPAALPPPRRSPAPGSPAGPGALADEVRAALDRAFGRG